MNIIINTKKIINNNLKKQLLSVKVIVVHNKVSSEFKGIFQGEEINLNTNIEFVENDKYDFIFSIVCLGKQLLKEKYSFYFGTENKYELSSGLINFTIEEKKTSNEIKKNYIINELDLEKNILRINPLAIIRKEENNKMTIYYNGNVYILKGILMNIVNEILNDDKYKESIKENNKIDDINVLISKGCIISYE